MSRLTSVESRRTDDTCQWSIKSYDSGLTEEDICPSNTGRNEEEPRPPVPANKDIVRP